MVLYLLFLFLTIVVLLNLLIAQMSDTYSSVQQDAQRSLAINRAWIVARVEHNSMLARVRETKQCIYTGTVSETEWLSYLYITFYRVYVVAITVL